MAGGGDYKWYQRHYQQANGDKTVAAADTATVAVIAAAPTGYTLYVQSIQISIITDAAQSLTFQDNGAPVIIAKTKTSPGLGPIYFDFGPQGYALTEAKELDVAISGAGLAAKIHAEGYYKQTGVLKAQAATNVGQN